MQRQGKEKKTGKSKREIAILEEEKMKYLNLAVENPMQLRIMS